jgi:hypothetical protein
MKSKLFSALVLASSLTLFYCSGPVKESKNSDSKTELSQKELIARGKYLVTIGACHDCHSPKIFTPHGVALDTTRLLSGHPADQKIPAIVQTQDWVLFNNGLTAFVGPWGVSYSANLTPDDTGIRNWKFEQFVTAIRKGKSKGLEGNRDLLPPMPWEMYKTMTDEDLKSVFTYLKSLPPVNNLVPAPLSPNALISQKK